MTKSENKNAVEMHGCIVCARTFNVLAVYTPDGRLVDCAKSQTINKKMNETVPNGL